MNPHWSPSQIERIERSVANGERNPPRQDPEFVPQAQLISQAAGLDWAYFSLSTSGGSTESFSTEKLFSLEVHATNSPVYESGQSFRFNNIFGWVNGDPPDLTRNPTMILKKPGTYFFAVNAQVQIPVNASLNESIELELHIRPVNDVDGTGDHSVVGKTKYSANSASVSKELTPSISVFGMTVLTEPYLPCELFLSATCTTGGTAIMYDQTEYVDSLWSMFRNIAIYTPTSDNLGDREHGLQDPDGFGSLPG